jgi:hypothetical protein
MEEYASRYITEVKNAGFRITRGNFLAPVKVRLRATRMRTV